MIVCPWCGTHYITFQSNCQNCGGPLPAVEEKSASLPSEEIPIPSAAPRPISDKYVWQLLSTDGWAITAFVFGLLGFIFSLVGLGLTLGIITAFVGIPFLCLGLVFLSIGGGVLTWRYQRAQKVVNVLRNGASTQGRIVEITQNYAVRINRQHPWVIRYQFQVNGQSYEGQVSTLKQPRQQFQVGSVVSILYLAEAPQWNSIYPHP